MPLQIGQDLKGKIVLVTGASGGIGSATVRALAPYECSFAVHYHSNRAGAETVVSELERVSPGGRHRAFQADLGTVEGVRALHADIVRELGPIDILFVNHGIIGHMLGRDGNIEDLDFSIFARTWQNNTAPAFLLSQLSIPHMVEKKWGRIVFCGSVAAGTGGVVGPHYASSKSALHGLLHWIAQRYAKDGITCNIVAPALIVNTGMIPQNREDFAAHIPVGRLGEPEEIAAVVEMLVKVPYMTNKVITADGGWTLGV